MQPIGYRLTQWSSELILLETQKPMKKTPTFAGVFFIGFNQHTKTLKEHSRDKPRKHSE